MKNLYAHVAVVISVALVGQANGSCSGATISWKWFDILNFCAFTGSSGALGTCTSGSLQDTSLTGVITDNGNCAKTCVYSYVSAVETLFTGDSSLKTTCGGSSWGDTTSPVTFRSGACLRALWNPIDAFNTCATGGVTDIVTGAANGVVRTRIRGH